MASDKRLVKRYGKIADQIIALELEMQKLKTEEFKLKTEEFKKRISDGEEVDNLLIEAYAVAREASKRILGLNAYRVQLIGGIILSVGDIAEMKTGEGKTLTGIFPAYLNALTGKGVHIVTVNEYLSRRDSEINGQVYDLLGITVGLNGSRLSKEAKRNAYAQDITYTTNSELGFDYLRDNMVMDAKQKVQRGLYYAIIDEADSILIDEARTPLIISGGRISRANMYKFADKFVKTLDEKQDLEIDLETKQVFLTESGMKKAKEFFSLDNLFDVNNTEIFHLIMNALKANFTFKEGVEYSVRDNEIVLIDQFTGRIMQGRSYSDGLQQALQAKENVGIEEETTSLATITYQNFYRLYSKIAGMTGTAKTEEEEFLKIYNTRVVQTPTNKPVIRKDFEDYTFATKSATLKHLMDDIKKVHENGNPILIGTTSVESSEQISRWLEKSELKFEMINAKNHDREADIIAQAGQKGAITLATNMAGRGTDIKLGEGVKELGGLVVFGVERNEARRIDNQLRGRSGRQGDPGWSRFYISMEDELMIRFTSPKIRKNFLKLGDDYIKSRIFTRSVVNAQKKLEGMNFDQRKDVLDYDNILAQQREGMYVQRDEILNATNLKPIIKKFQATFAYELILKNSSLIRGEKAIDLDNLIKTIDGIYVAHNAFTKEMFEGKEMVEISAMITEELMKFYEARISDIPQDVVLSMERRTILEAFDRYWTKHIDVASKLRSGIYLQQYAQNNPLAEYVEQATTLYNGMKVNIANEIEEKLSKIVIRSVEAEKPKAQQIQVTDKDIDEILLETGINKEELNSKVINEKMDALISQAQRENDSNKTSKLQIQKDILLGLVIELQKRLGKILQAPVNSENEVQISKEQIQELANKFDIKNVDNFKVEDVIKGYDKLMSKTDINNQQERSSYDIGRQILIKIAEENALIKTSEKLEKKEFKKPISTATTKSKSTTVKKKEIENKPKSVSKKTVDEKSITKSTTTKKVNDSKIKDLKNKSQDAKIKSSTTKPKPVVKDKIKPVDEPDKEYVIEDENGEVRKRIKKSKNGDGAEITEDRDQTSTKVKIG